MSDLGFWDLFLWSVATYVAVVALVRLMRRRRDEVLLQLQRQVAAEQAHKAAEERKRKREEARRLQLEQLQKRREALQSQMAQQGESPPEPAQEAKTPANSQAE